MALALYSPEDIIILLGGIYPVTGLHEGSFLSIKDAETRYETSVSADGRVSRTHKNVPIHEVSITLSSFATANEVFNAWAYTDGALYGAMLPLYIKDSLGSSVFYSPLSWIESVPQQDFADSVSERTWSIKCAGAESYIGSNYGKGANSDLTSLALFAKDLLGV